MNPFKIAIVGDIVGKVGIRCLRQTLPEFVERNGVDFVIANGENLAGGAGTTPDTARQVFAMGVDVITNGDHVFRRKKEFLAMEDDERLVRPANLPPRAAGRGSTIIDAECGIPVGVVNVIGRVFMDPNDCPFRAAESLVRDLLKEVKIVIVDFHAEATSEKMAMGWHLNGKATAVVGTHTHVPTADHQILDGGTAFITDLGMVGSYDSIIGRVKERVLHRFLTGMPTPFTLAEQSPRAPGVLLTVDADTGLTHEIEAFCLGEPTVTRWSPDREG